MESTTPKKKRFISRILSENFDRMLTKNRRFIPEVDGLRFIAISSVLIFHISGFVTTRTPWIPIDEPFSKYLRDLFFAGHYGVQLFFVLSGFLLAIPFAKHHLGQSDLAPPLGKYYLRRVIRLEPPYVVSLLLAFAGFLLTKADALSLWPNLLASVFYSHNIFFGRGSLVNSVAWSLEVEVQFYLLAPFFAKIFMIGSKAIRRIILLAVMIILPCVKNFVPMGNLLGSAPTIAGFLEYFAAGFFLAEIFLVDWKEDPPKSFRWDVAALLCWCGIAFIMLSGHLTWLLPAAIAITYVCSFAGRLTSRILSTRWMVLIGGMCYSMYLLHPITIAAVAYVTKNMIAGQGFIVTFLAHASVMILAVLAVTVIFFILVERPCMNPRWVANLFTRRSTGSTSVKTGK